MNERKVFQTKKLFNISDIKEYQYDAVSKLLKGQDCFISQPTGSGKSFVYQCLPFFYGDVLDPDDSDCSRRNNIDCKHGCKETVFFITHSVVLVVSPLVSLIDDQIKSLARKGIKSVCLREDLSSGGRQIDFEVSFHFS